ncbi:MAG: sugar MFS transporter [Raineya sp.]|nr:sugar MFS transporter [Raineya sp.]MDW8296717.1 sugar MFS transporter [Raineya sp.]
MYRFALITFGIFFFVFGFVTWLNSVLIPYLKMVCELPTNWQAYLVTFAFYISYFVMALPSAWFLEKVGFQKGMAWGLVVMALGSIIFIPAAENRTYEVFLIGLFTQGTGLAILQTAVNPYVAILGKPESAAQRISIMGIANKTAGIISPIVLGFIVFKDAETIENQLAVATELQKNEILTDLASKVIEPYSIMALVLIILAVIIRFISLPNVEPTLQESSEPKSLWQYPQLVLGVIALFLYVGVEVIAGDTIIQYGVTWGFSKQEAKFFTSFTLVGMLVGYVIAIFTIPRFLSQAKVLTISAILGVIFSLLILVTEKFVSVMSVALLGLANSVMWPAIFPLAIADLGKNTPKGSALLIMAIAGGALMPLLYGFLADSLKNERLAYSLLIPAYLFIAYYGAKGYKKRTW